MIRSSQRWEVAPQRLSVNVSGVRLQVVLHVGLVCAAPANSYEQRDANTNPIAGHVLGEPCCHTRSRCPKEQWEHDERNEVLNERAPPPHDAKTAKAQSKRNAEEKHDERLNEKKDTSEDANNPSDAKPDEVHFVDFRKRSESRNAPKLNKPAYGGVRLQQEHDGRIG